MIWMLLYVFEKYYLLMCFLLIIRGLFGLMKNYRIVVIIVGMIKSCNVIDYFKWFIIIFVSKGLISVLIFFYKFI